MKNHERKERKEGDVESYHDERMEEVIREQEYFTADR